MRIISGLLKGRKIETLKQSNYRPSTSKFRESLFNILNSGNLNGFDIAKANVLDLFCGTGSLGLEAISRGAHSVCFADINSENLMVIKKFIDKSNIDIKVDYLNINILKLHNLNAKFNLIFMDPPYGKNLVNKTLKILSNNEIIDNNAYIMIECEKTEKVNIIDNYRIIDERLFGKTKMVILHKDWVV